MGIEGNPINLRAASDNIVGDKAELYYRSAHNVLTQGVPGIHDSSLPVNETFIYRLSMLYKFVRNRSTIQPILDWARSL